ncbi:MAG: hypothetical protein HN366_07905 [Deltaproteobacteria bacterium]|jgi:hypothetical protein|nr:hypothetical protein [Deltaproteobacteria bacterium]
MSRKFEENRAFGADSATPELCQKSLILLKMLSFPKIFFTAMGNQKKTVNQHSILT